LFFTSLVANIIEHLFMCLLAICIVFFFWDRVLLCSLGWTWTHYVVQAGLKFMILLTQLPECWDCRYVPPCLACI
jgi:hypothetical protein